MKIGLTYDLRQDYLAEGYSLEETAECDKLETVEEIEAALVELGYATDRIGNGKMLIGRLAAGDRWDLVFNFAEGLHGVAREGQVPAILDMYRIPYTFSDPLVLGLALHKDMTKTIVRQAGVPTPRFALVRRIEDIAAVDLPFPLFAKPVAEGTSKGITADSKILDRGGAEKVLRRPARTVPPAGAGRNVPSRPRVHGRHHRDRRRSPSGGHHRSRAHARGEGRFLFLLSKTKIRNVHSL